jgi:hypothetical protein
VLRSNPWYYSLPLAITLILLVFIGVIIYIHYSSAPRSAPLTDSPSAAATGPFTPR